MGPGGDAAVKLLVFSDIHGSAPAARLVADLARERQPDYLVCLGDCLYHGPRNPFPAGYDPALTAEAFTPLAGRILAVRGNCDSDVDALVLSFPLASDLMWILDNGLRLCASHGHLFSPEALPPLTGGDVFLFGHTHVPMAVTTPQGFHLCNPGSLSLPKDGHPASYGWFEQGVFSVFAENGETYLRLPCM
jgi:putative phosphoesterase